MSNMIINDKTFYLGIDNFVNSPKKTISFDICDSRIEFDLEKQELQSPTLLTYFVNNKEWKVYTENNWHNVPVNLIKYLMSVYRNRLPRGINIIYE